jgi:regulator of RNase E activity RraB
MTDNWDFYASRVDGGPASIFVDLGIVADAPLSSHPYMAYVRLHMNQPRPDGLSSNEEFDTLVEIENALEARLCENEVGYVGRNTSGGFRDFYFYVSTETGWQSRVDAALAEFERYKYETGTREDSDWSVYLNFLLPGAVDRQRIENRRVCEALERYGDKLTLSREIDHWSYFPSRESVEAFIAEVTSDGFQVRDRHVSEDGDLRFGAQVWRIDTPSYDQIDRVTLPLFEAAERHQGQYDGWECPVAAQPVLAKT